MLELPNIFLFLSFPFTLFGISLIYNDEKVWLVAISSSLFVLWKLIEANVPVGFIIITIIISFYFILSYVKPFKIYGEWKALGNILNNS